MNRKLLIAIGVVLLAGGAGLAVALAVPGSHHKDSRDHGGGAAARRFRGRDCRSR